MLVPGPFGVCKSSRCFREPVRPALIEFLSQFDRFTFTRKKKLFDLRLSSFDNHVWLSPSHPFLKYLFVQRLAACFADQSHACERGLIAQVKLHKWLFWTNCLLSETADLTFCVDLDHELGCLKNPALNVGPQISQSNSQF